DLILRDFGADEVTQELAARHAPQRHERVEVLEKRSLHRDPEANEIGHGVYSIRRSWHHCARSCYVTSRCPPPCSAAPSASRRVSSTRPSRTTSRPCRPSSSPKRGLPRSCASRRRGARAT